ncbi:hypothetical protein VIGAN_10095300, partial [Vigna angularis var. angularis]
ARPEPGSVQPSSIGSGKARSKRTRGPPCNWSSRLVVLSPNTMSPESSHSDSGKKVAPRRRDVSEGSSEGRKCLRGT